MHHGGAQQKLDWDSLRGLGGDARMGVAGTSCLRTTLPRLRTFRGITGIALLVVGGFLIEP
jgi:hypothetical protein